MTVPFIFVANPVSFAFEGLGFFTLVIRASKRLDILVDMLSPVLEREKVSKLNVLRKLGHC